MKASILGLLERPEEAANKGRQARAHVLGELTWTRHAEKVLDSLACIS